MTDVDEIEVEDNTELALRNWGLSGQPGSWAWSDWQPVVGIIRLANTGFSTLAAVQGVLDATFPGMGYKAANVCLAHPVTAQFTAGPGDIDPDVDPTPYAGVVRVDLDGDEDLDLPDAQVTWNFGDGTDTVSGTEGFDHGYVTPGIYVITCTIPVAGVLNSTNLMYEVEGDAPAELVNPAFAERPATVFDSATDDQPNTSVLADELAEFYDPGDHTVDEVLAYAADHPEKVDAILEDELVGKNRSGIMDKL